MSKNQKGSSAPVTNSNKAEQINESNEQATNPIPTETPAPAPAPAQPTLEQLQANVVTANNELQTAIESGDYVNIGKGANGVQAAIKAVNAYMAKAEAEKAGKAAEEAREKSIDFVAEKFGLYREQIISLVDADKADANTPLRNALSVVFGGKVTVARDGQSGKSLSGEHGARGGKSKEIEDFLKSGTATKDELLARYPTEGNAEKLNGTARTILSLGKWKLNAAGVYEQQA
jgi:hypothetical protein